MDKESERQMVERHVREGQMRVDRQLEIIDLKRRSRQETALSEQLLEALQTSLALHRAHLYQLSELETQL